MTAALLQYRWPGPKDAILIAAFERGAARASHGTKYTWPLNPFSEPYQRDAWFAGYQFGRRG